MVSKISNNKKLQSSNKGLSLPEVLMSILLMTIATVGLYSAFAYGKAQLRETGIHRMAMVAAIGEIEIWKAQSTGKFTNFGETCFHDEPETELNFITEENSNLKVKIVRDCSESGVQAQNNLDWITFYDLSVAVYVYDAEDNWQNEDPTAHAYYRSSNY